MNKPVVLLPFIFVYRALLFIVKLPFKIILYNFYAIIYICYGVYRALRYILYGFAFPFVVLYRLLSQAKIFKHKAQSNHIDEDNLTINLTDQRIGEIINNDTRIVDTTETNDTLEEAKYKAIAHRKELAAIEEEKRKKRELAKIQKYALERAERRKASLKTREKGSSS